MIFTPLPSGQSVEGLEIEAFKTDIKSSKYLYILAGTHGDEVESVYVLKQLFEWLSQEHETLDLPLVVIPILNMDGYRTQTRTNARSVDLNRNYPSKDWKPEARKPRYNPGPNPLSEPENQYLNKLFNKYPPGVILSFHSWKPMLNHNGDSKWMADFLHKHNQYPLHEDVGYETPGSLGTWCHEEMNVGVLTFELPELKDRESLQEIWKENEKGLKALFCDDSMIEEIKSRLKT